MKNTLGNHLSVTLFGESHGPAIGVVLDGLTPGLTVDEREIARKLTLRRPTGSIATARTEADRFSIISGVFNGKTTGTPLCITIPNQDIRSDDYERGPARPGHADYTAYCKYHGYEDYRGGGHFSGRITAALVAAGAIVGDALKRKGITLASHVYRCGNVCDGHFQKVMDEVVALDNSAFPLLHPELEKSMRAVIETAKAECDSVGGVVETVVCGLPAGVGEPWFDSMEGMLSHALFSVPAIKGVEFGDGFGLCDQRGSQANDPLRLQGDTVITTTNHNGGINGGITNGMPVIFCCAVKPTPSIAKQQQTVDYIHKEETDLSIQGRHDPAIFHRACHVINAVTALCVYDILLGRFGTDWFGGDK